MTALYDKNRTNKERKKHWPIHYFCHKSATRDKAETNEKGRDIDGDITINYEM